jgi:hypothetical protein
MAADTCDTGRRTRGSPSFHPDQPLLETTKWGYFFQHLLWHVMTVFSTCITWNDSFCILYYVKWLFLHLVLHVMTVSASCIACYECFSILHVMTISASCIACYDCFSILYCMLRLFRHLVLRDYMTVFASCIMWIDCFCILYYLKWPIFASCTRYIMF